MENSLWVILSILIEILGVILSLNKDFLSKNRTLKRFISGTLIVSGMILLVLALSFGCVNLRSVQIEDEANVKTSQDVIGSQKSSSKINPEPSEVIEGENSFINQNTQEYSPPNPLNLYDQKPSEGSFNQIASDKDYFLNSYFNVIGLDVSGWTESDKHRSVTFINPGCYISFSGTIYAPKTKNGGANTTRFLVTCDGVNTYDSGEISNETKPVDFNIDITGCTRIEISCYYIKGSTQLVVGSGSAYGRIANAKFAY